MAETVDFVVYEGVLFDIQVFTGDIRLRLVVIVIRNEIRNGVIGEEFPEFRAELRRQRLVVCKNERRTVDLFDYRRHGERFSRTRHADERLLFVASEDALRERFDCFRLVAGRFIWRDEPEFIHFCSFNCVRRVCL